LLFDIISVIVLRARSAFFFASDEGTFFCFRCEKKKEEEVQRWNER